MRALPVVRGLVGAEGRSCPILHPSMQVFSFGCNDEGALGRPTSSLEPTSESTPALVKLPEPIAQLSAGDSHSAALAVSGTVYMWGNFRDSTGQVGLVTEGSAAQEPKKVATNIVQVGLGWLWIIEVPCWKPAFTPPPRLVGLLNEATSCGSSVRWL